MSSERVTAAETASLAAQYATSANLAARIALHQRCSTNSYGLQRWVFDRLALRGEERVLEVACGTGSLWRENRDRLPGGVELTLTDRSLGMVAATANDLAQLHRHDGHPGRDAASPPARFVACALPDLPFVREAFDVAIANHMLYHVDDRQRGLAAVRRVLRDGGTLFATTNGIEHLRELKELMATFGIDGGDISASFTLENGAEQLRAVFGEVRCVEYVDGLRVTEPSLLLAYMASMSERATAIVEARRTEIQAYIGEALARDGVFAIRKVTGLFVAR
jgi:SAM-dependent methyltransferase